MPENLDYIGEDFDFTLELLLREMGCNLIQSVNRGAVNFDDMLKNLDIYHKHVEHSLRGTIDVSDDVKFYKLQRFERLVTECELLIIILRDYTELSSPLE